MVSFNGACFDVPRILDAFNIPELPCAHIDMRWLCYHTNYTGGLKRIAKDMNIVPPNVLCGIDGSDAVLLWNYWLEDGDKAALLELVRYCSCDVLSLYMITTIALRDKGIVVESPSIEYLWELIPDRLMISPNYQ